MELAASDVSDMVVLELRDEFGGRIETGDLRGFVQDTSATRPTFKAEFGPMRFELDIQPLFDQLCRDLGITPGSFTPPDSPRSPIQYQLPAEECETDGVTPLRPLELLKLGVYKMFGRHTETVQETNGDEVVLSDDPENAGWLARLRDDAPPGDVDGFEWLRSQAVSVITGQPLWQMGFGNALLEVLSPLAVRNIQNEGTFYHLLPSNPNAAEWAIFWLRLFKLGGKSLSGIPEGVRTVTERLQAQLEADPKHPSNLRPKHHVTGVRVSPSDPLLVEVEVIDRSAEPQQRYVITADHVILALPKAPLCALSSTFPPGIRTALDQVDGFTLLKVFLCSRAPSWWPQDDKPRPQEDAWLMSTREVHYFRDGANAMTLLYMDEPESQKWAPFIQAPECHDKAEYRGNVALKTQLVRFVLEKQRDVADSLIPKVDHPREQPVDPTDAIATALLKLIEDLGLVEDFPELRGSQLEAYNALSQSAKLLLRAPGRLAPKLFADVSDYAIRDWSREPSGAGCHAWRPGARSWEIRPQLRAFALDGGASEHAHICGEAYSDYQGFIEGALRSAADAVATILARTPEHSGAL